ncbi:hypothetical protein BZA77DRAFT_293311 [Pyronema omphalodes]|nr:hypothetical protein BZA77DRAFT_293311 [Pyronema omphalodes]
MVILLRGRGNLHSVYRSGAGVARRRDVSKSAKVSAKTSTVTGTCFTFSGCLSSRPQSILGVQLRVCHADADALICWLSSAGSHLLWLVTRWLPLAAQRRTRKGRPRDVELRISKQTTSKTVCLSIALLPDAERRDDITTFNRDSIDEVDRATERQRPTRCESTTAFARRANHGMITARLSWSRTDEDQNQRPYGLQSSNHTNTLLDDLCFEDMNHSADGGCYAELIRDRSFDGSGSTLCLKKGLIFRLMLLERLEYWIRVIGERMSKVENILSHFISQRIVLLSTFLHFNTGYTDSFLILYMMSKTSGNGITRGQNDLTHKRPASDFSRTGSPV